MWQSFQPAVCCWNCTTGRRYNSGSLTLTGAKGIDLAIMMIDVQKAVTYYWNQKPSPSELSSLADSVHRWKTGKPVYPLEHFGGLCFELLITDFVDLLIWISVSKAREGWPVKKSFTLLDTVPEAWRGKTVLYVHSLSQNTFPNCRQNVRCAELCLPWNSSLLE